ncbi:NAD(P)H-dependent oxidoreductase [Croceitalea rosinachiae]|uniref:NAD(P)H-dependent oxidoreductase n=1 Tax=Croceitalea rosinachiae TaxID=3075596 RepID=A0ABU3AB59_9FLAO|nr:NAD(P)H-dependent oxidoreductase [Croceitalea sp. F388]MDT0607055.1 NAD(P)H-dependent oxidoreductase [Croceitalea sp. F388]
MKNILAFSGSNSPESINEKLIQSVIERYSEYEINLIDLKQFEAPIYSPSIHAEGIPKSIQDLYAIFQDSDGFIIASPEHNGLPTAFLKNTLDWLSVFTQQFFGEKPVLLLSTSPGATGAQTQLALLEKLMPIWGGQVRGTYSLGSFQESFDPHTNSISNIEELEKLDKEFYTFAKADYKPKKTNTGVVQSYFDAFQQGDLDAVLNVFHPDCYIVSVKEEERLKDQLHGIYRTRKEARQFLKNIVSLFETKEFIVDTVVEAGNNLVIAKGSFSHLVRSSGKLFNSNWVQLCVVEDEMIKEYRFYEDSAALFEASNIEYA